MEKYAGKEGKTGEYERKVMERYAGKESKTGEIRRKDNGKVYWEGG